MGLQQSLRGNAGYAGWIEALTHAHARNQLATEKQLEEQKEKLARIVQMLIRLLKKLSERADVLREEEGSYISGHDHDHEQEHE